MGLYKYMEPVNMPRGTHYGNSFLILPSKKTGRNCTAFSNLEFEHLLTLEMDPQVEYFCEQPLKTTVVFGGSKKETVFDCWVLFRDGREEFREVKYSADMESSTDKGRRCREQVAAQKMWCLQNGFDYRLTTDKEIQRGEFYIRNLSFLAAKARRFPEPDKDADRYIRAYLRDTGKATVGMLDSSGRFERLRTLDYLAYLSYMGVVRFGKMEDECITNKTEVEYIGE